MERNVGRERRTGICLNTTCDLARADCVEVGDLLTQDGLKVFFTNAFGINLASIYPDDHIDECTDKGTDTFLN